jgi:hypothetical protein
MLWATIGAAAPVAFGAMVPGGGLSWPALPRPLLASAVAVVLAATFVLGAAQGAEEAAGPFTRIAHVPVDLAPTDAIARFITDTTRRSPQQLEVVTEDRALLVTRPFYGFLPLRARYAHPKARLGERIGVLRAAAACADAACATQRLTRTPFGPIDALVLVRSPLGLRVETERDGFPTPTPVAIFLRPGLLDPVVWARRDVGRYAVFARRARP